MIFFKLIGKIYLLFSRWQSEGERPTFPKYVLIAAPHTSNWDLSNMLSIGFTLGLRVRWLGKRALFRPPFGWLMRFLGGIEVDRSAPLNQVEQVVQVIAGSEHIALVIAPEGTRGRREFWKSGFYHIARQAGIPIVMGFLDYKRKRGGFGPTLFPSDDMQADMDQLREFYRAVTACRPDHFTPPRLKDEIANEIPAVTPQVH